MSSCEHQALFLSSLNLKGGYKEPSQDAIKDALRTSGLPKDKGNKRIKTRTVNSAESMTPSDLELPSLGIFPAPLVLPGDELELHQQCPPQSVKDWLDEEDRNEITNKRRTIYIVPPPSVDQQMTTVNEWTTPNLPENNLQPRMLSKEARYTPSELAARGNELETQVKDRQDIPPLRTGNIVEYLQAFYHGLLVKVLERLLEFTKWQTRKKSRQQVPYIGLSTGGEVVRIRTRPSRDALFPRQLNLNDLLDAAISILPEDAYALLMLVNHDIYENEDDDFCCGRAYGGSRVAVVSTARYRPDLDVVQQQVEPEHVWPGSHCLKYVSTTFGSKADHMAEIQARKRNIPAKHHGSSAMEAAIAASKAIRLPVSSSELSILWLGGVCKTASHELGHCFGIDHCTYYACLMQGSASLAEDSRQPPYLCPVDLAKVLMSTGAEEKERYAALLEVCDRWKEDKMFAAFRAWIEATILTP